jgi:hypothetical protein
MTLPCATASVYLRRNLTLASQPIHQASAVRVPQDRRPHRRPRFAEHCQGAYAVTAWLHVLTTSRCPATRPSIERKLRRPAQRRMWQVRRRPQICTRLLTHEQPTPMARPEGPPRDASPQRRLERSSPAVNFSALRARCAVDEPWRPALTWRRSRTPPAVPRLRSRRCLAATTTKSR